MRSYRCHSLGLVVQRGFLARALGMAESVAYPKSRVVLAPSTLRLATVYRCPLWPWGAVGHGPNNVLVLDAENRAHCVPRRTLRRVEP